MSETAASQEWGSAAGAWIARAGRVLGAAVQVATEPSFSNLLFRHTLKLVYALEVLLIAAGVLIVPSAKQGGWVLLGLTLLAHGSALFTRDLLRRRRTFVRAASMGVVAGVLALAVLGLDGLAGTGLLARARAALHDGRAAVGTGVRRLAERGAAAMLQAGP